MSDSRKFDLIFAAKRYPCKWQAKCRNKQYSISENKGKQRVINKELDVVKTKMNVYSDYVNMEEVTRVESEEIMSRLKPFQDAAPELEHAFDEARARMLYMARDSVLTK